MSEATGRALNQILVHPAVTPASERQGITVDGLVATLYVLSPSDLADAVPGEITADSRCAAS